ncbi:MAG: rod shape-determining protein MreC [Candidatus Magasanikbacteria bacterium]
MRYYSFKKTYLIAMGIFFLIIIFHYLGALNFIENKLRNTIVLFLKPITAKVQGNNGLDSCVGTATSSTADQLSIRNKILEQENFELKNQLNFKTHSTSSLITAEIVAKNLDTTDQVIVLNKGSVDGVKIDQPVIYGNGILVGKIIKVEEKVSFTRVLSDNQSKIAATILNNDHSLGVVEGGFGLSIKMSFIPRNENIITGDQIITSGLEIGMPRGLIIGKVAAIENESYQPFQEAVITPAINYEKVNFVGILSVQ